LFDSFVPRIQQTYVVNDVIPGTKLILMHRNVSSFTRRMMKKNFTITLFSDKNTYRYHRAYISKYPVILRRHFQFHYSIVFTVLIQLIDQQTNYEYFIILIKNRYSSATCVDI